MGMIQTHNRYLPSVLIASESLLLLPQNSTPAFLFIYFFSTPISDHELTPWQCHLPSYYLAALWKTKELRSYNCFI